MSHSGPSREQGQVQSQAGSQVVEQAATTTFFSTVGAAIGTGIGYLIAPVVSQAASDAASAGVEQQTTSYFGSWGIPAMFSRPVAIEAGEMVRRETYDSTHAAVIRSSQVAGGLLGAGAGMLHAYMADRQEQRRQHDALNRTYAAEVNSHSNSVGYEFRELSDEEDEGFVDLVEPSSVPAIKYNG